MSVESRMATRAVFELVLTVAGWGLGIAAVVMFFVGQPGAGVALIVAAVVAFGISAASSRRKTTGGYAADEMNRAIALLRQRQYPQALTAAKKATEIASAADELRPGLSVALILLATARAVTGDEPGARRDLQAARSNAYQYRGVGEDMLPLISVVERELDRGVPDPDRLVREVLDH